MASPYIYEPKAHKEFVLRRTVIAHHLYKFAKGRADWPTTLSSVIGGLTLLASGQALTTKPLDNISLEAWQRFVQTVGCIVMLYAILKGVWALFGSHSTVGRTLARICEEAEGEFKPTYGAGPVNGRALR